MNIKILAAMAISLIGLSASMARADDHGWNGRGNGGNWSHDGRGQGGGWNHDERGGRGYGANWEHDGRGREGYRSYGHRDYYRAPRWNYGYAPRYDAPYHYYAPTGYAPVYDAPQYYAPAYGGGWFDNLGVVIQLHLP